jgi:hypothetical protein
MGGVLESRQGQAARRRVERQEQEVAWIGWITSLKRVCLRGSVAGTFGVQVVGRRWAGVSYEALIEEQIMR